MSPEQHEALAEFRYAIARFLAFSTGAARELGLEPRQHQALLVVKGWRQSPPPTISLLAERLQMRHNSAVGLVDRLSRRGLLRREADQKDHRCVRLRLTAAGNQIIARLSRAHLAELQSVGPALRRRLSAVMSTR
ncbi:MAG TPA: MarR family winged helix-turn-helix transcriptional regulator [Opitutaceae bacterium]|jgi:DNA-binding MarR family transcriptional regulator